VPRGVPRVSAPGIPPPAHGLLDVARGVLAELDVEVVLGRLLESARALTGARYAALGVLDEAGTGLAGFVTAGIDEDTQRRIGAPPTGHGVLGELIRSPAALRLADVGEHRLSYGFPPDHPRMRTFLGVPVLIDGRSYGNLYLAEKADGECFSEADEAALVVLADLAGLAIGHARRFGRSEARREELERAVEALEATVQIARALAGQTDLNTVLELVAKRGRALVSARALIIELLAGDEIVVAAVAGEAPRELVGRRLRLDGSVASRALATLAPQRLEDELNRRRFSHAGLGQTGVRADGGLVVPLALRGEAYGVLVAIDRLRGGPCFTTQDEGLLEAFAASAAMAVAIARTVSTERQRERLAAAEDERRRWARELHDETLQGLAGIQLALSAARRGGERDAIETAVEQAIETLRFEIANLRSLITELRPAALDELGVEAAIAALAERTRRDGVEVELQVDLAYEQARHADRHTPELETAIYRIIQEGLTNARRHGEASAVRVEVVEDATTVRLVIADNGRGFDAALRTDGVGLLGMRERVDLLHGSLMVESAPGLGTTLRASFPAARRRAGAAAGEQPDGWAQGRAARPS
jgi:signal transduction histidine kinase